MLKTRITVDQYDAITADDLRWTELVDGEIVVNEPRFPHGEVQASLIIAVGNWCGETQLATVAGPTEVRLTEYDSYGPDVVVRSRRPRLTERETLADPPLICVEVRSPSTWRYDIGPKRFIYEKHGVPELWLVDLAAEVVLVSRRSAPESRTYDIVLELDREDTLGSPLLPGFALPLAELFGD